MTSRPSNYGRITSELCETCQKLINDPRVGKLPEEPDWYKDFKYDSDGNLDVEAANDDDLSWNLVQCLDNVHKCSVCALISRAYQNWNSEEHGTLHHLPKDQVKIDLHRLITRSSSSEAVLITPTINIYGLHQCPGNNSMVGPEIKFNRILPEVAVGVGPNNLETSNGIKGEIADILSQSHYAYTGRQRNVMIDFDLLRSWDSICRRNHKDICGVKPSDLALSRLRAVDVVKRCIVEISSADSFVALSYVWGSKNYTQLSTNNKAEMEKPQSHLLDCLPKSIEDAIRVVLQLGYQYLWVDALCIIQDSDADLAHNVAIMDTIYALAELTVIAAAGADADVGLPGVRPETRLCAPDVIHGSSCSLIPSLIDMGNGFTTRYLGENTWIQRGWTFQERLLSRRALIFGAEQVYWECQHSVWQEDMWNEVEPPIFDFYGALDDVNIPAFFGPNHSETFDISFRHLVEHYSQRKLKYHSDYLNAFSAVLNTLARIHDQQFFWGLPLAFFGSALTWPCFEKSQQNRCFHRLEATPGVFVDVPLPSWSWLGWHGKIYWVECSDEMISMDKDSTGLRFYKLDNEGVPVELNYKNTLAGESALLKKSFHNQYHEQDISKEQIPAWLLSHPARHVALCFWTDCAENVTIQDDQITHMTLKQEQHTAEVRRKHDLVSIEPGSQLDAIVVCDTDTWGHKKEMLNIMLVTYKDGVAYKQGMVCMTEESWLALPIRQWKLVVLC